ncbi:MAG: hypothetical protein LBG09_00810 [Puniceicoccales bacterium]|jgi:DNA-binding response OmpR family regulator|nr:hypothetical protein [Puniceicoccales bacterium]
MTAPALLVVDGEKNTREALKKLLSADFDVYIAANLGEAQNYVRRQPF